MSGFENPDSAYADATDDSQAKRRDAAARKKDTRKDRKDKGYIMFEEEDSEEELVGDDATKSPTKVKKHVKPFKFVKKDKAPKPKEKEKDKDEKKEKDKKEKVEKEKDKKDKVDKVDKEKEKVKEKTEKTEKKVEKVEKERKVEKEPKEEVRWRTKKKFMPVTVEETVSESLMPVFGVPLPVAIERSPCHDGIQLPVVVRECIDYIEEFGLLSEGIYRISGVKSKVQALKDAYNKGVPVYLHDHEPNDIASLLKQFFRDLPEPVLTAKLMPKFEQASTIKAVKEKVEQFELLLKELPRPNKILLSWMIVHMAHVISREKQNKMTLQNVSIVLSPTMQISHRVLNIFFGFSKILFKDTVIKRYVPPLKPVSSRWSLELPDSPSAIEEELKKQESLLNHLHEELMKVKDMGKEEQLWEVQRVVTQLKRKLKNAKQVQMSSELAKRREDDILKEKIERGQQQLKQLNIADTRSGKEKLKTVEEVPVPVETECVESKPGDTETVVKQTDEPTDEVVVDCGKSSEIVAEEVSMEAELEKPETNDHEMPAVTSSVNKDESAVEAEVTIAGTEAATNEENGTATVSSVDEAATAETSNADDASIPVPPASEVTAVKIAVTEEVQQATSILAGSGDHLDTEMKDTEEVTGEVASATNTEPPKETSLPLDKPLTDISADDRKSPSDDSSDAYTDVLEEDETDHLSDILEKDIKPGNPPDVEYTELCEDSSATMELPGRAEAADQTDKELESVLDDSHQEESEHDVDERQYSERTTSSEPSEFEEDDEEHRALEQENTQLMLEEEELLAISDELRQKIRTEKREIERLHQDIAELQMIREEMYESDDSSSSSDESDDSDDLREILQQLIRDNEDLELENADLCDKIHQERQICIAVKVQNRMMQQRNLELSGFGVEDRESLL